MTIRGPGDHRDTWEEISGTWLPAWSPSWPISGLLTHGESISGILRWEVDKDLRLSQASPRPSPGVFPPRTWFLPAQKAFSTDHWAVCGSTAAAPALGPVVYFYAGMQGSTPSPRCSLHFLSLCSLHQLLHSGASSILNRMWNVAAYPLRSPALQPTPRSPQGSPTPLVWDGGGSIGFSLRERGKKDSLCPGFVFAEMFLKMEKTYFKKRFNHSY